MNDRPRELTVPALGAETRAWQYGRGNGAPLILVHGFRGDHHGLELIAERLAPMLRDRPVVVPDLPGFGTSPAIPNREHDLALYGDWLRDFTGNLLAQSGDRPDTGNGHFDILGHSFGSLVVARALADGLRPRSTTLINPISSPALSGPDAVMTQLAIAYYRAADALPERGARALLGNPIIVRVMSEVMAKTRDPELRRWIHGQHDRYFSVFSDPSTLLEAFRTSVSHTVAEIAAESLGGIAGDDSPFAGPILILAGDRDDISPLRAQLDLRHRLPDSELRVIPGVGHLVHYEAPEDAAVHTARFLRGVAASSAAAGKGPR